jgi:hypothetical protein
MPSVSIFESLPSFWLAGVLVIAASPLHLPTVVRDCLQKEMSRQLGGGHTLHLSQTIYGGTFGFREAHIERLRAARFSCGECEWIVVAGHAVLPFYHL